MINLRFLSTPQPGAVCGNEQRFTLPGDERRAISKRLAEGSMTLLIYYLVLVIVGDVAAYFIGRLIEYQWGSYASLIAFLALYFLVLWAAWQIAVRLTKPSDLKATTS
jgi:hypothetical protein